MARLNRPSVTGGRRRDVSLVVGALGSAVAWLAWMGWDRGYHLDPATGLESGPYEAWQVVGSAVTFTVAVVVACRLQRRPTTATIASVCATAYTIAYAATVVPFDETGLAVLGVVMVAVGTLAGALVVAVVTDALRRRGGPS